jgi:F420-0:gamma-glutamyl ligase
VKLADIKSSKQANALARKWAIRKELAQVVIDEADAILGGVKGFVLTLKEGMLTANAGVDAKNSPSNTVTLWPANLKQSAIELQRKLERQLRCRIGTIIVDSRVTPLRLGTTGLAIASSGFNPIRDDRGKQDLYGRKIIFTQTNIADDLAAATHLLMGEAREQVGAVLIQNPPIRLSKSDGGIDVRLNPERCLIANNLKRRLD